MNSAIANDLGRHLQEQIGGLVERNTKLAAQLVSPAEIGIMLIHASVSLTLTTAATIASHAVTAERQEDLYDKCFESIFAFIAGERQRSLDAVARKTGERAA